LLLAVAATIALAAPAAAHPMATSAVLLDVEAHQVSGEIQLPLDRLSVALDQRLTAASATAERASIEAYTREHVAATGAAGARWAVAVRGGHVETIDGTPHFVESLVLTPPGGKVTAFDLSYDVIIEQLVTHRAIATIRTQWAKGTVAGKREPLGVFDWSTPSLKVDGDGGSWLRGFTSSIDLGVHHIGEGADHLLFLLMLLIPAPLMAVRGRWTRSDDGRRSAWRIVHVVTAFAIGHSITLALAGFGVIHVPSRPVEALIACSILVSAIHAIRPIVRGGEALIAGGFGLVHGLAFAALIGSLGLDRGALVSSLLGFNLGIELTQLLVVALMMPSLYALSRTRLYPGIRTGIAWTGLLLSAAWLLERTGLIATDPLEPISEGLVAHPFAVAAAFAVIAAVARSVLAARSARVQPRPDGAAA
jgi:hypothetical protein